VGFLGSPHQELIFSPLKLICAAVRLSSWLCFLAIFSLSGLDRCFVQGYAWTFMIVDRAPERGFTEAVSSTFSGDEPCHLCEALAVVDTQETEPIAPMPDELVTLKSPYSALRVIRAIPPPFRWIGYEETSLEYSSAMMEIETPPPELS